MFYADSTTVNYRSASQVVDAMGRVYGNMALAVLTSMVVSLFVSSQPWLMQFLFTGLMKWVVIFSPILAVLALSVAMEKTNKTGAQLMLHGFAALMGLSFSTIFVVFNLGSIVTAFMGAAILFVTMSCYGFATKKDLTSLGQFMFVGLIAIVIASVLNIVMANFWPGVVNNALISSVISAIAIIVFLGLTAYDTQRIRQEVAVENNGVLEVKGALSLYLNFINIFLSLLQLFGGKEE